MASMNKMKTQMKELLRRVNDIEKKVIFFLIFGLESILAKSRNFTTFLMWNKSWNFAKSPTLGEILEYDWLTKYPSGF